MKMSQVKFAFSQISQKNIVTRNSLKKERIATRLNDQRYQKF